MRLSAASLRRVVKGDLTIQFVLHALTSYTAASSWYSAVCGRSTCSRGCVKPSRDRAVITAARGWPWWSWRCSTPARGAWTI